MAKGPEITPITGTVPIRTEGLITQEMPFYGAVVRQGDNPAHTVLYPGVGQTSAWLTNRAVAGMARSGSEYGVNTVVTAAPNHQKFADRDRRKDPNGFREVVKDRSAQFAYGVQEQLKNDGKLAADANVMGHSLGGMDVVEMFTRNPNLFARAVALVDYAGMTAMRERDIVAGLVKSSMPYDRANGPIGTHAGNEYMYDKLRLGGQSMSLVADNKTNQAIVKLLVRHPEMALTLVGSRGGKFQRLDDVFYALSEAELEAQQQGTPVNLIGRTVVQEGGHRASATKDGGLQAVSVVEHMSGGRQLPSIRHLTKA